jgi:hypothetical protein
MADEPTSLPRESDAPSRFRSALDAIDRWAASATRAFVTWLVLYVLSVQVFRLLPWTMFRAAEQLLIEAGNIMGFSVSTTLRNWWMQSSSVIAHLWFVPLMLRLNLIRGLLWITVSLLPFVVSHLYGFHTRPGLEMIAFSVRILCQMMILRGHRRPAFMVLVCEFIRYALSLAIGGLELQDRIWKVWCIPLLDQSIYAAILLYGTKKIEPR